MTTAIERLRASKEAVTREDQSEGRAAGRAWAENDASYRQLKRLANVDLKQGMDAEAGLRQAIDPHQELEYQEFLENTVGADNEDNEEYIEAFVMGAQEFFVEVRGKI
jgi:hypothetical protein